MKSTILSFPSWFVSALSAVTSRPGPRAVRLHQSEVSRMDADSRGLTLRVLEGVLWITQTGDQTDHVISAGEDFVTFRSGRVVAESITPRARLAWSENRG